MSDSSGTNANGTTNATSDKLTVENGEIRFKDACGDVSKLVIYNAESGSRLIFEPGDLWLNQPLAASLAPILAHFARTGRLENPPQLDHETLGRICREAQCPPEQFGSFDELRNGDFKESYCRAALAVADYVRCQVAPVESVRAKPEPPNVVTFTASDFDNYDAPAKPADSDNLGKCECGHVFPDDADFCPSCNAGRFCTHCDDNEIPGYGYCLEHLEEERCRLEEVIAKERKKQKEDRAFEALIVGTMVGGPKFMGEVADKLDSLAAAEDESAENLASFFHDTYERLAPSFGYETRKDTKKFDSSSANGKLMIAVAKEVLRYVADNAPAKPEPELDREWCGEIGYEVYREFAKELKWEFDPWANVSGDLKEVNCKSGVAFARRVLARYGQRAPQGVVESLSLMDGDRIKKALRWASLLRADRLAVQNLFVKGELADLLVEFYEERNRLLAALSALPPAGSEGEEDCCSQCHWKADYAYLNEQHIGACKLVADYITERNTAVAERDDWKARHKSDCIMLEGQIDKLNQERKEIEAERDQLRAELAAADPCKLRGQIHLLEQERDGLRAEVERLKAELEHQRDLAEDGLMPSFLTPVADPLPDTPTPSDPRRVYEGMRVVFNEPQGGIEKGTIGRVAKWACGWYVIYGAGCCFDFDNITGQLPSYLDPLPAAEPAVEPEDDDDLEDDGPVRTFVTCNGCLKKVSTFVATDIPQYQVFECPECHKRPAAEQEEKQRDLAGEQAEPVIVLPEASPGGVQYKWPDGSYVCMCTEFDGGEPKDTTWESYSPNGFSVSLGHKTALAAARALYDIGQGPGVGKESVTPCPRCGTATNAPLCDDCITEDLKPKPAEPAIDVERLAIVLNKCRYMILSVRSEINRAYPDNRASKLIDEIDAARAAVRAALGKE